MITITNNNIFYSQFSLSTLSSLNYADKINPDEIVNFLSDDVELGESVTLKRLFEIASYNVDNFNFIYNSALGGYNLEPYLQEIENVVTEISDIEYIEVCWDSDKFEEILTIKPSMCGVSDKKSEYYALDFESLNNIKDYNIRLNEKVEVFDFNKKTESDDKNYIGKKPFTLFDLYYGILFEISFNGGPQDKKEKIKELEDTLKESEMTFDDFEKTASMTLEEIYEKIDSNDEYIVKYNDMRSYVDEQRLKNKKNLKKIKSCLIEKLKIYDLIKKSDDDLKKYYKKMTDIEYNLQTLYDEEENISYHKFWETPKCICPKIDNIEIYPSNKPYFNSKCPIHGK